jgi:predicted tellurium resistance membrane protein TerC
MGLPFLKLVGGLALLWIAIKLLVPDEQHGEESVKAGENLFRAVRIVAIADIVMSLDNVIAIAAAAKGDLTLIVFGLVVSIPMIIAGAAMLMALLDRFPILVWAGAALLGWIAGEIMIEDPATIGWLGAETVHGLVHAASTAGALFVVAAGWYLRRRRHLGVTEGPLIVDPPGPEVFPPHHAHQAKDRA